jgi:AcrR family transcriptional regulator
LRVAQFCVSRSYDEGVDGLRERKKRATRRALSHAALRLAAEQGFDNLLVEDIAAAAGVSMRTFNNYFASKADAVCATRGERMEHVVAALEARPAGEPIGEALRCSLPLLLCDDPEADAARVMLGRLLRTTPELRAQQLASLAAVEPVLAAAIARRCGWDPDALAARVLAAATLAAFRVAFDDWLRASPSATSTRSFLPVLDQALRDLGRRYAMGDVV